jgi:hypothetical protein
VWSSSHVASLNYLNGQTSAKFRLQDISLDLLARNEYLLPAFPTVATPYLLHLTMSRRQQVLSFPRVPTLQERMLDVIKRTDHSIQAFDPKTRSLKTFPWYAMIPQLPPEEFTHSCIL